MTRQPSARPRTREARVARAGATLAVGAGLVLAGCTAVEPSADPAQAASPAATTAAGAGVPGLVGKPSGKTAAQVLAVLPNKLSGRARSDNGTNPRQITVAGKPGTVHSYVYAGKKADDYVALQVSTTSEAALLFPAGAARLESLQLVGGASCGVGSEGEKRMNVCYALLNDGVLTVAEPTGKLAALGNFTTKLSRAEV